MRGAGGADTRAYLLSRNRGGTLRPYLKWKRMVRTRPSPVLVERELQRVRRAVQQRNRDRSARPRPRRVALPGQNVLPNASVPDHAREAPTAARDVIAWRGITRGHVRRHGVRGEDVGPSVRAE